MAWSLTTLLVALATGVGLLAGKHFAEPDVVMLYLLVVVVAATRFGRGPALLASAMAVLAYDFFFVTPNFTFAVADERHLVTFATLFIVGLSISALATAARRAARKANTEELRSSLLSSVSHDLRTPLAAITGAATTLRDRANDLQQGQRDELVGAICDEAERLERLVSNLLDMSRLQSGVLEVKRDWVPLEEVVGAALSQLERQLDRRPVKTALPPDLPLVPVDPILLEQVFCNLLDNAARYSPSGTPITICARSLEGVVEVTVDDEGPGLEPGSEARVFEKFYRGKVSSPGAGLGLAICRGVVEVHGGTLVAGRAPAGGARFTITLPLVGQPPAVPRELQETSP
ncbi:MAG: PAS domain-containing sensor histidine kinase [Myxococcaceae bacterium]|jgi:two-component system sensor histidine kinase KdpD|nr:PAS domain-containing sensor histidine kinase [Myxococcaceae bacterium]MCA3015836.1 PAS domain-containing sensor histidine kinase [Myxococcaceae bacterium]